MLYEILLYDGFDELDALCPWEVVSGVLALHLVERQLGPAVALAAEPELEYERRGTLWRDALRV